MALSSKANAVLVAFRSCPSGDRVEMASELTTLVDEITKGTLDLSVRLEIPLAHVVHAEKVAARYVSVVRP